MSKKDINIILKIANSVGSKIDKFLGISKDGKRHADVLNSISKKVSIFDPTAIKDLEKQLRNQERDIESIRKDLRTIKFESLNVEMMPQVTKNISIIAKRINNKVTNFLEVAARVGVPASKFYDISLKHDNIKNLMEEAMNTIVKYKDDMLKKSSPEVLEEHVIKFHQIMAEVTQMEIDLDKSVDKYNDFYESIKLSKDILMEGPVAFAESASESMGYLKSGVMAALHGKSAQAKAHFSRVNITSGAVGRALSDSHATKRSTSTFSEKAKVTYDGAVEIGSTAIAKTLSGVATVFDKMAGLVSFGVGAFNIIVMIMQAASKFRDFNKSLLETRGPIGLGINLDIDTDPEELTKYFEEFYGTMGDSLSKSGTLFDNYFGVPREKMDSVWKSLNDVFLPRLSKSLGGDAPANVMALNRMANLAIGFERHWTMDAADLGQLIATMSENFCWDYEQVASTFGVIDQVLRNSGISSNKFVGALSNIIIGTKGFGQKIVSQTKLLNEAYLMGIFGGEGAQDFVQKVERLFEDDQVGFNAFLITLREDGGSQLKNLIYQRKNELTDSPGDIIQKNQCDVIINAIESNNLNTPLDIKGLFESVKSVLGPNEVLKILLSATDIVSGTSSSMGSTENLLRSRMVHVHNLWGAQAAELIRAYAFGATKLGDKYHVTSREDLSNKLDAYFGVKLPLNKGVDAANKILIDMKDLTAEVEPPLTELANSVQSYIIKITKPLDNISRRLERLLYRNLALQAVKALTGDHGRSPAVDKMGDEKKKRDLWENYVREANSWDRKKKLTKEQLDKLRDILILENSLRFSSDAYSREIVDKHVMKKFNSDLIDTELVGATDDQLLRYFNKSKSKYSKGDLHKFKEAQTLLRMTHRLAKGQFGYEKLEDFKSYMEKIIGSYLSDDGNEQRTYLSKYSIPDLAKMVAGVIATKSRVPQPGEKWDLDKEINAVLYRIAELEKRLGDLVDTNYLDKYKKSKELLSVNIPRVQDASKALQFSRNLAKRLLLISLNENSLTGSPEVFPIALKAFFDAAINSADRIDSATNAALVPKERTAEKEKEKIDFIYKEFINNLKSLFLKKEVLVDIQAMIDSGKINGVKNADELADKVIEFISSDTFKRGFITRVRGIQHDVDEPHLWQRPTETESKTQSVPKLNEESTPTLISPYERRGEPQPGRKMPGGGRGAFLTPKIKEAHEIKSTFITASFGGVVYESDNKDAVSRSEVESFFSGFVRSEGYWS